MPRLDEELVYATFSGEAWTGEDGRATVLLPSTVRGHPLGLVYEVQAIHPRASARVSQEARDGRFELATSVPHVKVAWRVAPRLRRRPPPGADLG
jgi:hypothetical protein